MVPAGEVQPPAATHAAPQAAAGKVADAIAKADASGWHSLSAADKGLITRHYKALTDSLRPASR